MFNKIFFTALIFTGSISYADTCKTIALENTTYKCPQLTTTCLTGQTTKGQIDLLYKNGHEYKSFGLPFCSTLRSDQNYCEYQSSGDKKLHLYPENSDSYDFTGTLALGVFRIDSNSVYSCNYKIIN